MRPPHSARPARIKYSNAPLYSAKKKRQAERYMQQWRRGVALKAALANGDIRLTANGALRRARAGRG